MSVSCFTVNMLAKQDILEELTYLGVVLVAQEADAFCQCGVCIEPCATHYLSRLPWRPIPVETILFPLLYRLLGCNLFALLFFILYGHCLWFGNFEGGAVAWSKLSHRLYFHQHCQVLKIFLLEIHYLVNLAKYMWPIN